MSENDQTMTKKKAKKKVKNKNGEIVVHNFTKTAISTGYSKIQPGKCASVPENIAEALLSANLVEVVKGIDS